MDENIPIPAGLSLEDFLITRLAGRAIKNQDVLQADALFVRSVTKVNAQLLQGSKVSFVASATAGIDHLDQEYLKSAGIHYAYAPGSNAPSVVDYVLACLAAIDRDPREARVGIVGCGQVGGRLYKRLKALGAQSCCYDPFLSHAEQENLVSFEKVLASDILCLHTPLTESGAYPTKAMIGRQQLMALPENAVLINAGRGGVVVEKDLKELINTRPDLQLIVDVWENEPNIDTDLADSCAIATPHIAGYAAKSKIRGSQMIFEALFRHFDRAIPDITEEQSVMGLRTEEALSNWQAAVLKVYEPRLDDARLKELISECKVSALPFGEAFDLARKNYPKRKELGEFCSESAALQAFGFSPPSKNFS